MGQCGNERKPCPVQTQSAGHGLGGSVAAQTSTSATAGKHSSNSTQAANAGTVSIWDKFLFSPLVVQ